jgi:hypothetical protein
MGGVPESSDERPRRVMKEENGGIIMRLIKVTCKFASLQGSTCPRSNELKVTYPQLTEEQGDWIIAH